MPDDNENEAKSESNAHDLQRSMPLDYRSSKPSTSSRPPSARRNEACSLSPTRPEIRKYIEEKRRERGLERRVKGVDEQRRRREISDRLAKLHQTSLDLARRSATRTRNDNLASLLDREAGVIVAESSTAWSTHQRRRWPISTDADVRQLAALEPGVMKTLERTLEHISPRGSQRSSIEAHGMESTSPQPTGGGGSRIMHNPASYDEVCIRETLVRSHAPQMDGMSAVAARTAHHVVEARTPVWRHKLDHRRDNLSSIKDNIIDMKSRLQGLRDTLRLPEPVGGSRRPCPTNSLSADFHPDVGPSSLNSPSSPIVNGVNRVRLVSDVPVDSDSRDPLAHFESRYHRRVHTIRDESTQANGVNAEDDDDTGIPAQLSAGRLSWERRLDDGTSAQRDAIIDNVALTLIDTEYDRSGDYNNFIRTCLRKFGPKWQPNSTTPSTVSPRDEGDASEEWAMRRRLRHDAKTDSVGYRAAVSVEHHAAGDSQPNIIKAPTSQESGVQTRVDTSDAASQTMPNVSSSHRSTQASDRSARTSSDAASQVERRTASDMSIQADRLQKTAELTLQLQVGGIVDVMPRKTSESSSQVDISKRLSETARISAINIAPSSARLSVELGIAEWSERPPAGTPQLVMQTRVSEGETGSIDRRPFGIRKLQAATIDLSTLSTEAIDFEISGVSDTPPIEQTPTTSTVAFQEAYKKALAAEDVAGFELDDDMHSTPSADESPSRDEYDKQAARDRADKSSSESTLLSSPGEVAPFVAAWAASDEPIPADHKDTPTITEAETSPALIDFEGPTLNDAPSEGTSDGNMEIQSADMASTASDGDMALSVADVDLSDTDEQQPPHVEYPLSTDDEDATHDSIATEAKIEEVSSVDESSAMPSAALLNEAYGRARSMSEGTAAAVSAAAVMTTNEIVDASVREVLNNEPDRSPALEPTVNEHGSATEIGEPGEDVSSKDASYFLSEGDSRDMVDAIDEPSDLSWDGDELSPPKSALSAGRAEPIRKRSGDDSVADVITVDSAAIVELSPPPPPVSAFPEPDALDALLSALAKHVFDQVWRVGRRHAEEVEPPADMGDDDDDFAIAIISDEGEKRRADAELKQLVFGMICDQLAEYDMPGEGTADRMHKEWEPPKWQFRRRFPRTEEAFVAELHQSLRRQLASLRLAGLDDSRAGSDAGRRSSLTHTESMRLLGVAALTPPISPPMSALPGTAGIDQCEEEAWKSRVTRLVDNEIAQKERSVFTNYFSEEMELRLRLADEIFNDIVESEFGGRSS